MSKLLFFDIDGTLAYPGQQPSDATIRALRAAQRNGHKILISTGRTANAVPKHIAAIGFDGGVYSAGGYIVIDGKVLANRTMPDNMARNIVRELERDGFFYILECAEGRFKSENAEQLLHGLDLSRASSEMQRLAHEIFFSSDLYTMRDYNGEPVYKIGFFGTDTSKIHALSQNLDPDTKVVYFENLVPDFPILSGEVSDFRINKGTGLQTVCAHYRKTPDDCIAFGDSMNDAEILQAAGLGIAMGNAEPRVKELADDICGSCKEDGVAKALASMHLIAG
ncbi:MAG: HAD family hydrolase [Eubacteriales bacterium]|nr:HAD family hydrolase [Eubacteriales bacterium]